MRHCESDSDSLPSLVLQHWERVLLAHATERAPRGVSVLVVGSAAAYIALAAVVVHENGPLIGATGVLLATWVGVGSLFSP